MDQPEEVGTSERASKIIKRYSNRKLYDTVESRYVTLDEIAEMVKQGTDVAIIDNRSKEDLTSVTLAQIIFEEEKKRSQMPLSVLRQIIRHPSQSLTGFLHNEVGPRVASLREGAETRVASLREGAETRIDRLLRREGEAGGSGASTAEGAERHPESPAELGRATQRAWEEWQKRIDERVKHVVEGVVGSLPAIGKNVQTLEERLEELEKKLSELESNRRSKR